MTVIKIFSRNGLFMFSLQTLWSKKPGTELTLGSLYPLFLSLKPLGISFTRDARQSGGPVFQGKFSWQS